MSLLPTLKFLFYKQQKAINNSEKEMEQKRNAWNTTVLEYRLLLVISKLETKLLGIQLVSQSWQSMKI